MSEHDGDPPNLRSLPKPDGTPLPTPQDVADQIQVAKAIGPVMATEYLSMVAEGVPPMAAALIIGNRWSTT